MKTQIQKPQNVSHTIQTKTKAANQASIAQVLQKYKDKTVQREALPEENELLQGKFETAQREELDDEEPLQGKFASGEAVQREAVPNNTGLPDNLKTGVENLSGYSMDDVRVHYNSPKPAQLQALAYTQGTDIHVAPGQEKHLPHEAWHVVQQKQGRVQPTMQLRGVNVNDNEGLEHEADVMGEKILQLKLADPSSVAADMCNENHRKICFNAATEEKYKSFETWKNLRGYPPPKIGDIINRIRPKVHDIPIPVDYQDKGMALPMQNNLINWLRNGKREHMWINNSGTIRVADRNFEKKPHPTLAGGDPDVKCAGLLYCGEYPKTVTVTITNQSGHFKPGDVDEESKQKIENVLNKTEKKTFVVVHNR